MSSSSSNYYFGKYTINGLRYLSNTVNSMMESNKLSAAVRTELTGDFEACHILDIIRPSKEMVSLRIYNHPTYHTVVHWNGGYVQIPHLYGGNTAEVSVYTHPTLNTKETPHYAAAIIIGGHRMVSFIWYGGKVYISDTSCTITKLDALYDTFVRNVAMSQVSSIMDESITCVADSF